MSRSEELYEQAVARLPGGVNSPVRAFGAVGGTPRFITKGSGSRITDVDDNEYIDFVCSWGPLILGHANPTVAKAAKAAIDRGSSFGTPTKAEVEMAQMIHEAFPNMELLRLVSSGTEACMAALRAARGFTGRDVIVKFDGCYHGHADSLLVQAGSGATTFGTPDSAGIPESFTQHTYSLPFNDVDAISSLMNERGSEIAAVIVEPIGGNMGVVPPQPGFLETLRSLTRKFGTVLIFDEVITGFRVAYGGAQAVYGIQADLTTLGKIIGGGFPVGAYGGRREIMECIAPLGPVYQAGTLSGNPVAVAAGIATLKALQESKPYSDLDNKAELLQNGLSDAAESHNINIQINRVGSMLTLFFTDSQVWDYVTARQSDTDAHATFFHSLLERGIFFPPSQFEACFISTAHSLGDIDRTVIGATDAFSELHG